MGRRAGRTSFFDDTWMYRRKIPAAEWTRVAQRRGRGGRVCFLLVIFSLHKQRKVTRSPKGRESSCSGFCLSFCFCLGDAKGQVKVKARAFAPLRGASTPFFACAKKRGPKKAHPASAPTPLRGAGPLRQRDFSTRHPCRGEKRRASMHVALRVLPTGSVAAEGAR